MFHECKNDVFYSAVVLVHKCVFVLSVCVSFLDISKVLFAKILPATRHSRQNSAWILKHFVQIQIVFIFNGIELIKFTIEVSFQAALLQVYYEWGIQFWN